MITKVLFFFGIGILLLFWFNINNILATNFVAEVNFSTIIYSLLGGILPALLWLWFWLKEDAKNPEPKGIILMVFLSGMVAVLFTIPFEHFVYSFIKKESYVIFTWSLIEETIKYLVIYLIALKSRFFNEPIDALIYMITGALGFAALENSMYLFNNVMENGVLVGTLNTHLRFLGATLLHVVSSSAIGIAIAFSFYKNKAKKTYTIIGITVATLLHMNFNLLIIKATNILETLIVFSYYWLIIIVLIFIFEKIKTLKKPSKFLIN